MADFINYNDTIPSPPDGYINVKWQKDAIGNVSAYYLPGTGGGGSGAVDSVFGRIGNVTAQSGDYNVSQITNAVSVIGSYSDPDWIIALDWDKLTNVPTTFSPSPHTHDTADVISGIFDPARLGSSALTRSNETQYLRGDSSWEVISYSEISNKPQTFPPSVHTHDSAEIVSGVLAVARLGTGTPSSSNYLRGDGVWAPTPIGPSVLSFNGRTGVVVPALGDYPMDKLASAPGATSYLRGDGAWRVITAAEVTNAVSQLEVYNNPDWIGWIAYSKVLGAPSTYPPSAHTHDASEIISGILSTARLGTGNPSSSNYLRGDGTWATISAGSSQTPWTQNIDGATFALYNAGAIQITTNRTPTSGAGLELTYDTKGYINPYDRNLGVFKELEIHGNPMHLYSNGSAIMTIDGAANKVIIAATSKLWMAQSNGERICIYDSGGINHAIGVEANCMYQQVATNSVFRWYAGGNPDNGANPNMELGTVLGLRSNFNLRICGGYAGFNLEYTDGWRHTSPGAAGMIRSEANNIEIWTAPTNSAGAVANITRALAFRSDSWIETTRPWLFNANSRQLQFTSGGAEAGMDFYFPNAGAELKRTRLMATPYGAIGWEVLNDAYSAVISYWRTDRSANVTNVPIVWSSNVGMKMCLYPGSGTEFNIGIEGSTMYYMVPNNCAHRWYLNTVADGGASSWMDLSNLRLFSRVPLLQLLPTSQTDPVPFSSTGSASYMYFDPGTKKLAIRYHEYGVAYRTYYLKEGDQGGGTTIYDAPADYTGPSNASGNALLFRDTFQFPANTNTVRITFRITHATGGSILTMMAGISTVAATKGQMLPTGSAGYFYLFNTVKSIPAGSIMYVDITLTKSGTNPWISGEFWIDSGAKQTFLEYKSLQNPIASNHFFIAGTYSANMIMRNLLAISYY